MKSVCLVNGVAVGLDPADRGLAYGDGLFETMLGRAGRVRWLEEHLDRLLYGCRRLAIPPLDRDLLREEVQRHLPPDGSYVIKLTVTRGIGRRGYMPPEPASPNRILSIHPWSPPPAEHYTRGIVTALCALRLGQNAQLAGLKHLCRLEQVLAQMELTGTDADEGLLRNEAGLIVGAISSNVFAVRGSQLLTPPIDRCGVRGVMRRIVLERAAATGLRASEQSLDYAALLACDEIFVTNAVFGIKPVRRVETTQFGIGEGTQRLMHALEDDFA